MGRVFLYSLIVSKGNIKIYWMVGFIVVVNLCVFKYFEVLGVEVMFCGFGVLV